jgi:integrase
MYYLHRVNRTYYCRVIIPKDLKPHFSSREIKISLKTTSKTEARKLLPTLVSGIQQHFFNLRWSHKNMKQQPTISAEAVAIFKEQYPKDETHISIPKTQYLGEAWGWHEYGQEYIVNPDLAAIQERLDEGWQLNDGGEWEFIGVHQGAVIQTINSTSPPSPEIIEKQKATKKSAKSKLTLQKAIELYLAHCVNPEKKLKAKPRAKSTLKNEEQALTKLSDWFGSGKVSISDVVTKDFYEFSEYIVTERKLAKSSANMYLNCLKRFFKYLKEFKHINEVPTLDFLKLQGDEKLKTANIPYTNAELRLFFDYVIDNKPIKIRDRERMVSLTYLILMFIYTGFRKSEQLTVCEVIYIKGTPVFNLPTMTKDTVSSVRYVPIHSKLISLGIMKYIKHHTEKMFPLNDANYRKQFDVILRKTGIKSENNQKTFHACRATFDTNLHGKIEDSVRHILLGHAGQGMDKIYVHQIEDKIDLYKKAVEKCQYDIDFTRLKAYLKEEMDYLYT